jgi:hypothetical protein
VQANVHYKRALTNVSLVSTFEHPILVQGAASTHVC